MCTHPHKSTGTVCGTACQSPLRCSAARSGQVAQLVEQRTEKTRGLCGPLVLFSGPGTHPPHLTPSAGTDRQTLRQTFSQGIPTPDIVILRSQLDRKWGAPHSAKPSDFSQPALRLPPGLLGDQKKTFLRPGSSQNAQFPGNA